MNEYASKSESGRPDRASSPTHLPALRFFARPSCEQPAQIALANSTQLSSAAAAAAWWGKGLRRGGTVRCRCKYVSGPRTAIILFSCFFFICLFYCCFFLFFCFIITWLLLRLLACVREYLCLPFPRALFSFGCAFSRCGGR